jgi:AcrR family transcriptional regulator
MAAPRRSRDAATARRTQAERTATTRRRLIDAAIESLAEQGYAATSSTVVAERAGVSRGALFYNFPTKGEFMLAVLDDIYRQNLAQVLGAMEGRPFDRAFLLDLVELTWPIIAGARGVAMLQIMLGGASDPEVRPRLPEQMRRIDDLTAQTLRERGGLGPRAGQLVAQAVRVHVSSARGLALQLITGASGLAELQPERDLMRRYMAFMVDELLPRAMRLDAAGSS